MQTKNKSLFILLSIWDSKKQNTLLKYICYKMADVTFWSMRAKMNGH